MIIFLAASNDIPSSSSVNEQGAVGNSSPMSLFDQLCRASNQNDSETSRKDLAADLRRHVVTQKASNFSSMEDPVAVGSFHARRLSERTQKRLMDEILRPVSGSYNVYDGELKGASSAGRQHRRRAPSIRQEKFGKELNSPAETPLPTPPIPPRLPKSVSSSFSRKSSASASGGDVDASPVPLTPASLLDIGQLSMSSGTPIHSLNQPPTPIFRFPSEFSPIVESCRELNYCELAGGSVAPPNTARDSMVSMAPSVASMPSSVVYGGPKIEYVQIDALATFAAAKV